MVDRLKTDIDPSELVDNFNGLMYLIRTVLRDINTVEVVRVEGVDSDSKTVTVIPIVKGANASGNPMPESPIYNVKYIQWQYGNNMIKATPAIGDIGIIVVCKKDISSINSGLIGSYREFSLSDGVYFGGLYGFNQEPSQIIEFDGSGIKIKTPTKVVIESPVGVDLKTPKLQTTGAVSVGTGASGLVYTGTQVLTFADGILTNIGV